LEEREALLSLITLASLSWSTFCIRTLYQTGCLVILLGNFAMCQAPVPEYFWSIIFQIARECLWD
jgi:hypothetical protein